VPFPSFISSDGVPRWEAGVAAELSFAFLIEIHQPLAEMNHRKSIKRTELSAIPGVESDSSNSGGYL
jgi:hypothetical protein